MLRLNDRNYPKYTLMNFLSGCHGLHNCQLRPPRECLNYIIGGLNMSRNFQSKNKDLVNLEIKTADEVWDFKNKRNGKPTLSNKYDFYGRIDKGSSAFIKSTNKIGTNYKFIEDTYKLPKNAKNKIVDMFDNRNKKVAYLVKKKK